MKVFVTGGTGNLGQNVTLELLKRGHEVVLYTRTPDRIPAYKTMPGVTLCQGDILEHEKMAAGMRGCDAVIHIALGWGNTPVEMLTNDTLVTCFLMEEAEKQGLKKMIYTSSSSVLDEGTHGLSDEVYLLPTNLYSANKAASEKYMLGFNLFYNGQGVNSTPVKLKRNIIRPGYIFSNPTVEGGASQSDTMFLEMAKKLLRNEDFEYEDVAGTQWISGKQIALLYADLLESNLDRQVFMAMSAKFISLGEIAQWGKDMIPGCTSEIKIIKTGKPQRMYDVSHIEKVFGLSFDATEDMKEHIAWNIDHARKILNGEEVHNVYHVW